MLGEARVAAAVAGGVVGRADEVGAGAVAVVVDGLLDAVAVGVELGADVGERVPLRRVLQRERDGVVGPDVDVLRVAEVRHLAHVDVVEDVGRCHPCPRSARCAGGWRRWLSAVPPGKSSGRLRQKLMPASTSRTPWRTFSGVIRLMRPSSSSSPQSPHVEPSGRRCHRLLTALRRPCPPHAMRPVVPVRTRIPSEPTLGIHSSSAPYAHVPPPPDSFLRVGVPVCSLIRSGNAGPPPLCESWLRSPSWTTRQPSESGQSRVGRCACGGDLEDLVAGSEPGSPDDRLGGEVRGFGRTAWRQVLVLADLGEGVHQPAAHSSPTRSSEPTTRPRWALLGARRSARHSPVAAILPSASTR